MYLFNQDLLRPYPVLGDALVVVTAVNKTEKVLAHIPSEGGHDKEVNK